MEINSGAAGRNILQIVDTNPTADFARAVSSAAASAVAAAVKSTDQYRLPERIEAQVQKLGEAVALSTYLRCRTEEDAMKQQREWAIVKTYRLGTIPDDQRHGEHR